jgi:pyruvate/2-oxoglutarate dehydrogenase complex dihydrolipoamide acyltransferase (E2) component
MSNFDVATVPLQALHDVPDRVLANPEEYAIYCERLSEADQHQHIILSRHKHRNEVATPLKTEQAPPLPDEQRQIVTATMKTVFANMAELGTQMPHLTHLAQTHGATLEAIQGQQAQQPGPP